MHTLYQWIESKKYNKDRSRFVNEFNDALTDIQNFLPEITDTMKDELIALVGEDEEFIEYDSNHITYQQHEDFERANKIIKIANAEKSRIRTAINNYFEKRV